MQNLEHTAQALPSAIEFACYFFDSKLLHAQLISWQEDFDLINRTVWLLGHQLQWSGNAELLHHPPGLPMSKTNPLKSKTLTSFVGHVT